MTNSEIAVELQYLSGDRARTKGNLYRARAFRQAAIVVLGLPREASEIIAQDGTRGLERFPGVGRSIARTIAEIANGQVF